MVVEQITPDEAKALLDSGEGYVYLDVRSDFEFAQGHAAGAYNIPIQQVDPGAQRLLPNPDFLAVVQAIFPADSRLLLGCASGRRSNVAGAMLRQHGYENVANIQCGFSGVRDFTGSVIQAGWSQLNFPVETGGDGGKRGYAALRERLINKELEQ